MNFEFPAEALAFRAELLEFLEAELPPWWVNFLSGDERNIPFTREFCKKLAAKGWLTLAWPKEYGGHGLGEVEQTIFANEAQWADVHLPAVTLQTVGPTLIRYGTEKQKEMFLGRILAGDASLLLVEHPKLADRLLRRLCHLLEHRRKPGARRFDVLLRVHARVVFEPEKQLILVA